MTLLLDGDAPHFGTDEWLQFGEIIESDHSSATILLYFQVSDILQAFDRTHASLRRWRLKGAFTSSKRN